MQWIVCLALVVVMQHGLLFPSVSRAEYLTISGCSISSVGYLAELAREYERRTGVQVFVRGGGSIIGIEDLRGGKVDVAASCRPPEADNPGDLRFIPVAWDALVFIVHKSNPLQDISLDDVRSIYDGSISTWLRLNGRDAPIRVFMARAKKGLSGVAYSTRRLVLDGSDPAESPNSSPVSSSAIAEQLVERTVNGFAATGITSARKRKVKVLTLDGVAPSNLAIIQNRYPLRRPLFLVIPKAARPEVLRFIEFALSKEGQQFIKAQGVVSLMDVQ